MTADATSDPAFEHADIDPEQIAEFGDRLLARQWSDEPFEFDGVPVEPTEGAWVVMLGVYDPPEEHTAQGPEEMSAARDWVESVRRAAHRAWDAPMVRTPHFAGETDAPEGIVDLLLVTLGLENAEMWDRGERFIALLTGWRGEPEASSLMQVMLILPRHIAMGGLSELAPANATAKEYLMHGESLAELHRRAAIMSALFGGGEARLRDTTPSATRCSLQDRAGATTSWTFADDGRALLLIRDPKVTLDDGTDDGELAASSRLMAGIPEDLLACIAAPGSRPDGSTAQQELEFGLIADQPVPLVTGAFWFDGDVWHVTRGLIEISAREGWAIDDFGFAETVRRPYRLGGTFTVDDFADNGDDDRSRDVREYMERVFDTCPYPSGSRPEGTIRLGYAIPTGRTHGDILDDIERVSEVWWTPDAKPTWQDDTFHIGGRGLVDDDEDRALTVLLAEGEPWYLDELADWTDGLFDLMSERWGRAFDASVHDDQSGALRRTPVTRAMRAAGFEDGPMWWVNGHAVVLLAGRGSQRSIGVPSAMLVIAQADAVLDLMRGTTIWELRPRARVVGTIAGTDAEAISWNGPALGESEIVPDATRGGIRTEFATWAWHFTHDGRALILSCTHDFAPDADAADAFERQAELFEGVPDDLLSLIANRDPAGLYDVIERPEGYDDDREGVLGAAPTLPLVTGVCWRDGLDWRVSDGLLRRAYEYVSQEGRDGNPLRWISSANTGLATLGWVLRTGGSFVPDMFEAEQYTEFVFGGPVDPTAVTMAFDAILPPLEAALSGSLNDVMDITANVSDLRGPLDAALSNLDPTNRREISLWLVDEGANPSTQLSFLTPLGVLLENPTLDAEDAPLLRKLVASGAEVASTTFGATVGGHALVQLCDRDLDEAELEPLYEAIIEGLADRRADGDSSSDAEPTGSANSAGRSERIIDVSAPALRDGRSVYDYVSQGVFPHARSRSALLRRLTEFARPPQP